MSRHNQRKIGELLKADARDEDLRLNWETDVVYLHAVDLLDRLKARLPLDHSDYEFLVMALEDYILPAARGRIADQQAKLTKAQKLEQARAEYRRFREGMTQEHAVIAVKAAPDFQELFAGKEDKTIKDILTHPKLTRD